MHNQRVIIQVGQTTSTFMYSPGMVQLVCHWVGCLCLVVCFVCWLFQTESPVVQAGFKFTMWIRSALNQSSCIHLSPKRWDYICAPPHPASCDFFKWICTIKFIIRSNFILKETIWGDESWGEEGGGEKKRLKEGK